MFTLSLGDVWRGLVMAVLGPVAVAILGVLGAVILAPHFDVFAVDWVATLKSLTNAFIISAYSGFSGYILKNFLTDKNQNFLGIETKS
jgi:hypothetical protein